MAKIENPNILDYIEDVAKAEIRPMKVDHEMIFNESWSEKVDL